MKTLYFISGLPRSGSGLISSLLQQNPNIHSETHSDLAGIFRETNLIWNQYFPEQFPKLSNKTGALLGLLQGYYQHLDQSTVLDNNLQWIPLISTVEAVLQQKIKIVVCVRNPAEILTSFERYRKENPLISLGVDQVLKHNTSVAARAYYYAGPDGVLGMAHRNIKDAIVMGYLDRMLFVDYNRFCNSPRSQTQRIYEFLNLPEYQHDFQNIAQYDSSTRQIQNKSIHKVTVNCVEYLGLELYEQYNREIFWNAWV